MVGCQKRFAWEDGLEVTCDEEIDAVMHVQKSKRLIDLESRASNRSPRVHDVLGTR